MTGAETLLKNMLAGLFSSCPDPDMHISAQSLSNHVNVSVTTARAFGRKYSGSVIDPFVTFTYKDGLFHVFKK